MKARMRSVSVILLIVAVPVHWVAVDEISRFEHQPIQQVDSLKKPECPIRIRPPPLLFWRLISLL